ncbi:MAG TPA: histidine kinase dimerization/phosphoacceptor domain -containing protein [Spirochaetota bacterium]|nr:histidine kinase dimerization/phosphoacceptor domain -containing protein [Spirochaetota bacterium]
MEGNFKRILLVEDEPVIALLETQQLRNEGYAVTHVNSGEKAVGVIDEKCDLYDLILIDIDLGEGIDGTEAANRILFNHDIPVLFLSSHTEKDVVGRTEKITSYGYVVKNSGIRVLDASIKMAFKLFDAHKDLKERKHRIKVVNAELKQTIDELQRTNRELEAANEQLKKDEAAMRQLLSHRDILMKELHHRVKNNLGVVSGLLSLERERVTDDLARSILADARSRISSIMGIYERLYLSDDVTHIDLNLYIGDLAGSILKTYMPETGRISLSTELADIRIETRRAVPLGLILNELITNALKYAYPGNVPGEIMVRLHADGSSACLHVSDSGSGLPEGFDPYTTGSMGFMLVRMLAEQIGGEFHVEGATGTSINITFRLD